MSLQGIWTLNLIGVFDFDHLPMEALPCHSELVGIWSEKENNYPTEGKDF